MFLIFAFDRYYPAGGWNDCLGVTETIEEAIEKALEIKDFDFFEIVDLEKRDVVWSKS